MERFLEIAEVIVELPLHLKPDGGVRYRATAFRICRNRLTDLYQQRVRLRPQADTNLQQARLSIRS